VIAHVAEAGEDRGRVVVRMGCSRPSPVAIEAAILVAQAWNSELEGVAIEDPNVLRLASFPFAREIATTGRWSRSVDAEMMERELRHSMRAALRDVLRMAAAADVRVHAQVMRADPIEALAAVCRRNGPWNVVALTDPIEATSTAALRAMLEEVSDATGLVLVGRHARRTRGPVVVVLEEPDHLGALLRAAERLAAVHDQPIGLLLVGERLEDVLRLEGEVRLALHDRVDVPIMLSGVAHGEPAVIAEAMRRLAAGFLIARFGGLAVPGAGSLRPLTIALECPMLLVR
jgi:hypothetical protein